MSRPECRGLGETHIPSSLTTVPQKPPTPPRAASSRHAELSYPPAGLHVPYTHCDHRHASPRNAALVTPTATAMPGRRRLRAASRAEPDDRDDEGHVESPPQRDAAEHADQPPALPGGRPGHPGQAHDRDGVGPDAVGGDRPHRRGQAERECRQPARGARHRIHDRQPEQHHRQRGECGRRHPLGSEGEVVGVGALPPRASTPARSTATTPGARSTTRWPFAAIAGVRRRGPGRCRSPRSPGPRSRERRSARSATTSGRRRTRRRWCAHARSVPA